MDRRSFLKTGLTLGFGAFTAINMPWGLNLKKRLVKPADITLNCRELFHKFPNFDVCDIYIEGECVGSTWDTSLIVEPAIAQRILELRKRHPGAF